MFYHLAQPATRSFLAIIVYLVHVQNYSPILIVQKEIEILNSKRLSFS